MGSIKDFFNTLRNGFGNLFKGATGSGLTDSQIEANAFSAQQAQLSREFEERMYTQYNSPGAQVQQMQSAGLNPALMYGSAGSSPAPSSSPSATSVNPGSPFSMLQELASLAQLKSQIRLTNAEANKVDMETYGIGIENEYKPSILEQNLVKGSFEIRNLRAGIAKVDAETIRINEETRNISKDTELKDSQIALNAANALLASANTVLAGVNSSNISSQKLEQDWRNSFIAKWNFSPDSKIFGLSLDMLAAFGDNIDAAAVNLFNKIKDIVKPSDADSSKTLLSLLIDAGLSDQQILSAFSKFGYEVKPENLGAKSAAAGASLLSRFNSLWTKIYR